MTGMDGTLQAPKVDAIRRLNRLGPALRQQLPDRLAGAILERIGDLHGAPDGTHVLLTPVDAERFVDGRVEVSHRHDAVGDVVSFLVAGADYLARFDPSTRQRQRPAIGPVIAAEIGIDVRRAA